MGHRTSKPTFEQPLAVPDDAGDGCQQLVVVQNNRDSENCNAMVKPPSSLRYALHHPTRNSHPPSPRKATVVPRPLPPSPLSLPPNPDQDLRPVPEDGNLPFDPGSGILLGSGGYGRVYAVQRRPASTPPLMVVKIASNEHSADQGSEYDDEDNDEDEDLWSNFSTELELYEYLTIRRQTSTGTKLRWAPEYYGSGTIGNRPWIALELMGPSIHAMNVRGRTKSDFRVLALDALRAVEGLHAEGYIHRDIKPEVRLIPSFFSIIFSP